MAGPPAAAAFDTSRASRAALQLRATLAVLASCALALGACSADQGCDETWPTATGTQLRVSAACGADDGDGSADRPFATIGAALAEAGAGSTVVVAAGSYAESLSVPADVSLRGAGSGEVELLPPSGVGVRVDKAGSATIAGLTVRGAQSVGVLVSGATVQLEDVAVQGTTASPGGAGGGHGVQISDAPSFVASACALVGNAGTGLLAKGVGAVSIIDPIFAPSPRTSTDRRSIVEPIFAPASKIEGNKGGGIAIIDPIFAPAGKTDATAGKPALTLTATLVSGNRGFGVALYGAGASIVRSAIAGTTALAGQDFADGLVVAPRADADGADAAADTAVVVDADSLVAGNGRAGLLVAAAATADVDAEVASNGFGGVWVQGDLAVARLGKDALVRANQLYGVAATAGASLDLDGCGVVDTVARPWASPAGGMPVDVGDGVAVLQRARARVRGVKIEGNARAGVLVDRAGVEQGASAGAQSLMVEIKGTSFVGGSVGIAVNSGTAGAPTAAALQSGNTFDKVANKVDTATTLKGQAVLCSVDGSGKGACDDRNPCTTDTCDNAKGCTNVALADGAACDDGNPCTSAEACKAGACVGVGETCDDGNPCTSDSCAAGDVCSHVAISGSCQDGDLCTVGDVCVDGACVGQARDCDDGDAKTVDSCDSATGGCGYP